METGFGPEKDLNELNEEAEEAAIPTVPVDLSPADAMRHHLCEAAREYNVFDFGPLTEALGTLLNDTASELLSLRPPRRSA